MATGGWQSRGTRQSGMAIFLYVGIQYPFLLCWMIISRQFLFKFFFFFVFSIIFKNLPKVQAVELWWVCNTEAALNITFQVGYLKQGEASDSILGAPKFKFGISHACVGTCDCRHCFWIFNSCNLWTLNIQQLQSLNKAKISEEIFGDRPLEFGNRHSGSHAWAW